MPASPTRRCTFAYQRFTTGATYTYSVTETQTNVHVAGDVDVETPAMIHHSSRCGCARSFRRQEARLFKGTDLYAFVAVPGAGGTLLRRAADRRRLGFDRARTTASMRAASISSWRTGYCSPSTTRTSTACGGCTCLRRT